MNGIVNGVNPRLKGQGCNINAGVHQGILELNSKQVTVHVKHDLMRR
jgi:hypothetical protein